MSMDEMREQVQRKAVERIGRIRKLLEAFEAGDLPAPQAVGLIENVASGEDDRIVRIGNTHTPEIQT